MGEDDIDYLVESSQELCAILEAEYLDTSHSLFRISIADAGEIPFARMRSIDIFWIT